MTGLCSDMRVTSPENVLHSSSRSDKIEKTKIRHGG